MNEVSDETLVLTHCRELEAILRNDLGVKGGGLGAKAAQLRGRVPMTYIRAIWRVAAARNKVIHDGEALYNRDGFVDECEDLKHDLRQLINANADVCCSEPPVAGGHRMLDAFFSSYAS